MFDYILNIFFRYLDPDMYSMMDDNSDTFRSEKFKKLTQAICGLVGDVILTIVQLILIFCYFV